MTSDSKSTPMMEQYLEIKGVNPNCLLFFRMGDFFELFFDDARVAAEVLGIAIAHRGKHLGNPVPMAGVPVHASSEYMHRLALAGYRVAVCDQTEEAAEAKKRGPKSVVKRGVVRLFTPGTLTEEVLLNGRDNNYLCCISHCHAHDKDRECFVIAWLDLSIGTPHFTTTTPMRLSGELSRISPAEIIVDETLAAAPWFRRIVERLESDTAQRRIMITPRDAATFHPTNAKASIKRAYSVITTDGIGRFSDQETGVIGAMLEYVRMTQVGKLPYLSVPVPDSDATHLYIDSASRRSLEITQNNSGGIEHTLLSHLDTTKSNGGARLLRDWLNTPSVNLKAINERLDAVGYWVNNPDIASEIRDHLARVGDPERSIARISLERGGPRDLTILRGTMHVALQVLTSLNRCEEGAPLPTALASSSSVLSRCPIEFFSLLSQGLNDRVPVSITEGDFIRPKYDTQLDRDRELRDNSHDVLSKLESRYRKITGIKTLRIRTNSVLGYFIEASPQQAQHLIKNSKIGEVEFVLRQTLASAVRFTTAELASLASDLASVIERIQARETELFNEFVELSHPHLDWIRSATQQLSLVDVWCALATVAQRDDYVRPSIKHNPCLNIKGGRHPIVERSLRQNDNIPFIANDCTLEAKAKKTDTAVITLLTGPNMAGKSTYLRQVVLITVMAQMGSWVPAQHAEIGLADQIFSRVGAADDLARGRSTFMVEMVETASILNQATSRSLVILDEIGRGTATYDGLAIAWSCVEYLHNVIGCRTLFATHYHEITALSSRLPGAQNLHLTAKESNNTIVFLHQVKPGAANRSWGVHVACLAGLPNAVTDRARKLLATLEDAAGGIRLAVEELPLFGVRSNSTTSSIDAAIDAAQALEQSPESHPVPQPINELITQLREIDINDITPREAMIKLEELQAYLNDLPT